MIKNNYLWSNVLFIVWFSFFSETDTDLTHLRRSSDSECLKSSHHQHTITDSDSVDSHYEKMTGCLTPKTMRSVSLYNLPAFQSPTHKSITKYTGTTNSTIKENEVEYCYHDIKLICPSQSHFELSTDDILEIRNGKATYQLLKKEQHNTQFWKSLDRWRSANWYKIYMTFIVIYTINSSIWYIEHADFFCLKSFLF